MRCSLSLSELSLQPLLGKGMSVCEGANGRVRTLPSAPAITNASEKDYTFRLWNGVLATSSLS